MMYMWWIFSYCRVSHKSESISVNVSLDYCRVSHTSESISVNVSLEYCRVSHTSESISVNVSLDYCRQHSLINSWVCLDTSRKWMPKSTNATDIIKVLTSVNKINAKTSFLTFRKCVWFLEHHFEHHSVENCRFQNTILHYLKLVFLSHFKFTNDTHKLSNNIWWVYSICFTAQTNTFEETLPSMM